MGAALLGLWAGLAASAASAETGTAWVEGYNSKVRLIAGARGGKPIAGVEVQVADGWKTYWRAPGDSGGVPPHFDWSGSVNLAAADVLYPAPKRMHDPAGDSIGYKGSVVFPVTVRAADPTKSVRLALALEYGICKDICVPAEAKLTLELPAQGADALPDALAQALAQVPRKAGARRDGDPQFLKGTAQLSGAKPTLTIEAQFAPGAKDADAFIEAPEGIYVPMPRKKGDSRDGKVTFEVVLSQGAEAGDLKGKTLTVTLVAAGGQSEASWTVN